MNPGMYPLIDPQAQGIRKLAGQVRSGFAPNASGYGSALQCAGLSASSTTNLSLVAATRTRILSISGRGAARFALINNGTGSSTTLSVEVWIDGVKVIDTGNQSLSTGNFLPFVGSINPAASSAALDFLLFDTSLEMWTTSTSAGTHQCGFLVDLHQ